MIFLNTYIYETIAELDSNKSKRLTEHNVKYQNTENEEENFQPMIKFSKTDVIMR
jgi:hypothetical protein